ncbi:MAG: Tad domain-containing protein [Anaerolineales bacterium]|nr:Tad domain-containing protein [Anaerolineales bacterium]
MIKNCLNNIKSHLLHGEQKGQSIIIVTFAFLGLIAMLGLALDLGLVYIERVRVSRTADAATLAGVVELPFEEAAMRRAIEYIELNGYKVGVDTEVRVRGCISNDGKLVNVSENGKGMMVIR